MNLPTISVIIPNYNHAAFLEQRIKSVLSQTFQDFEVILLDDCSTDNSREIIEQYRNHPKISRIIYNTVNSGSVFRQWKTGINEAQGKYIWFAESDDWCEPTLLQYLVAGLENNDNCVISYCQSYATDSDNRILWQSQYPYLSDYVNGQQYILQHMVYNNGIFNASMVVWRKRLFTAIKEDYLDYQFCGDWVFWIELCKQGDVFITGRVLNYFRNHAGDVSTRSNKTGLNFIETTKILYKLYHEALIPGTVYKKALRKKHREYWHIKAQLDNNVLLAVKNSFYNIPAPVISPAQLKRDAWWKNMRLKWKK